MHLVENTEERDTVFLVETTNNRMFVTDNLIYKDGAFDFPLKTSAEIILKTTDAKAGLDLYPLKDHWMKLATFVININSVFLVAEVEDDSPIMTLYRRWRSGIITPQEVIQ